jgi:hypothetical protein
VIGNVEILTESELHTLEQSSGDDCCMASVTCVIRELRSSRSRLSTLRTWAAARLAACDKAIANADVNRLSTSEVGGYLQERRVVEAVMGMVGSE